MSPIRLTGSTSGYSQIDAPAVAGDQTFTLPGTGGVVDTRNRAGNILQVVNATYSTSATSSSTSYADTGLTATITPASTSSKILVLVHQAGCAKSSNNIYMFLKLLRGSTDLILFEGEAAYNNSTSPNSIGSCSCVYLDSPSSTTAVTYKTQFKASGAATQVAVQASSSTSTITLLEVAA